MRRRSERKKSTDVSSPAPASRRSSRRSRKSPSPDRNEEMDDAVAFGEQQNDRQDAYSQRDSSEERAGPPRRGSRNTRHRTPLRESPATTPAKRRAVKLREISPEATTTKIIDSIPEEENGQSGDLVQQDVAVKMTEPQSANVFTEQAPSEPQHTQTEREREGEDLQKTTVAMNSDDSRDVEEIPVQSAVEDKPDSNSAEAPSPRAVPDLQGPAVCGVAAVDEDKNSDNQEPAELDIHPTETGEMLLNEETKSNSSSDDAQPLAKTQRVAMAVSERMDVQSQPLPERPPRSPKSDTPPQIASNGGTPPKPSKSPGRHASEKRDGERSATNSSSSNNNNNNNGTIRSNTGEDNGRTTTTTRKRKWLTKKCSDSQTPVLAISTDSLKNLISDVHPVPLSDVQLESSSDVEEVASEREEGEESPSPEPERRPSTSGEHEPLRRTISNKSAINAHDSAATVAVTVGIAGGTAATTATGGAAKHRSLSPANNRTSSVLFITNLVRPFTVLQLKGLLARTGKITENGFWIDRIKSKCFVEYETEDEAIETRHALHGVRWPVSNPKCLNVEFGAKADLVRAIEQAKEEAPKFGQDNNKDNVIVGQGWRGDRPDLDLKKNAKPVREWDVGKKDSLDRDKVRERDGKHPSKERDVSEGRENHKHDKERAPPNRSKGREGRSHSLSPVRKMKKKEDPPLRLLDDLFRKTKATPCIYWLPLTPEQIAEKEAFRQKRIEEHKERLKQRELERGKEREKERTRANERDRERDRDRENRERDHRRNRSSDRRRSRSRDRRRY